MNILDANGTRACAECGKEARAVCDKLKAENEKLREENEILRGHVVSKYRAMLDSPNMLLRLIAEDELRKLEGIKDA